jgi:transposase
VHLTVQARFGAGASEKGWQQYLVGVLCYKNLREYLRDFLCRKQALLPEVEVSSSDAIPQKARGKQKQVLSTPAAQEEERAFRKMSAEVRVYPERATNETRLTLVQERKQAGQARRSAQHETICALHAQGLSGREIARRLDLARRTVKRFLEAEGVPEYSKRAPCGSILDPYKAYLHDRWRQGCHNGAQLYAELQQQGYTGSGPTVFNYVRTLRKERQTRASPVPLDGQDGSDDTPPVSSPPEITIPRPRLSPTQASWLCMRQPKHLDEAEQQLAQQLQATHPEVMTAYQLAQTFVVMLANRQETGLDPWLVRAEQSGIAELRSFAQGIRRDYQAVQAAFTSPWSNGQVEGQVGRLKLLKRQMYGRANFDLLRVRVLH